MAAIAQQVNSATENIGARRLYTILEKVLEDLLYQAPDAALTNVDIDKAYVESKLSLLAQNEDMSRFIL
jgi:ATP-dependent HslUV protease ATP-binding subunit HslU